MTEDAVTIFSAVCPFRKDGTPVLGTMGSQLRGVIVIDLENWKLLLERVPELKTTPFRVGEMS